MTNLELINKWKKGADKFNEKANSLDAPILDRLDYRARANQLLQCVIDLLELIKLQQDEENKTIL